MKGSNMKRTLAARQHGIETLACGVGLAVLLGASLALGAFQARAAEDAMPVPAVASTGTAAKAKAPAPPVPGGLTREEPASPREAGDFTIVVLPDTQFYTSERNGGQAAMFVAQAEWIISNRVSRNIAYVATEGDISNDGSGVVTQWRNATNALYRLEDPVRTGLPDGIPYGAVVGNHDTYNGGTGRFNEYFGVGHFAGHAYYGGHYGTNNDSHVDLFSAGGQDFIVLALTMAAGSNSAVMQWADGVLASNANRRAIVVTHSLLNPAPWPEPASWTKEGPSIFQTMARHPNVFLMLCGHRHGEGRRHETVGDRAIDIVLADYQASVNGGNGYLRLLEVSPARKTLTVKTFSPWAGMWATNAASFFTLDYPPRAP